MLNKMLSVHQPHAQNLMTWVTAHHAGLERDYGLNFKLTKYSLTCDLENSCSGNFTNN